MLVNRLCRGVDCRLLCCHEGNLWGSCGTPHKCVCVCVCVKQDVLHITRGCNSFRRLGFFDRVCFYPGDSALLETGDNTAPWTKLMSSNNQTDNARALTKPMHVVFDHLVSSHVLHLLWNGVNDIDLLSSSLHMKHNKMSAQCRKDFIN